MIKTTTEIRQAFIDFFCQKGHKYIKSSSLIPKDDTSLLFTNAGMNQFKNIFIGKNSFKYERVTTCQRCVRISGKHNDLENIGYTPNHHTFFEMLGNFSFGDYFKKEAINFAWELLTNSKWFSLPKEKLFVSVYYIDNETYDIWTNDIKLSNEHIIKVGDNKGKGELYSSDNFWQMGDIGPCGPCTEIFFNIDNTTNNKINYKSNNLIEIWNLVFIQFFRKLDGTFVKLDQQSVDTGMGLERISSILQNVNSNYEIDIFNKLIKNILHIIGFVNFNHRSLFIIADHIRSCIFLISDGVIPSNEGTGYILRRLIRRAVIHGYLQGIKESFFYKLVAPFISVMNDYYYILILQKNFIVNTLRSEEEKFLLTLDKGINLLKKYLKKLNSNILDGKIAFILYDTYGFPLDLTIDICNYYNIKVDVISFKHEMYIQRCRSRKFSNFSINNLMMNITTNTKFIGYDNFECKSKIIALFNNKKSVNIINANEEAIIVLDKTPFYGESGGQIGDSGVLKKDNNIFEVINTKKFNNVYGHFGKLLSGTLKVGENVFAKIQKLRRNYISINHTATHLLHYALRKVLGNNISQKGSFINDKYLRFDFTYSSPLSEEQILLIEKIINKKICDNKLINSEIISYSEAIKKKNVIAQFNKKYKSTVRLLVIDDFSLELCGGTHTSRTGNIGLFHIKSEYGISSGIRRIDAVTGEIALSIYQNINSKFKQILKITNTDDTNVVNKIIKLQKKFFLVKKEIFNFKISQIKKKLLLNNIKKINDINILINKFYNINFDILKIIIIDLQKKFKKSIILFISIVNNTIYVMVKVTPNINYLIKANEIINYFLIKIKGKGGGNENIAQAVFPYINELSKELINKELINIEKIITKKLFNKK